MNNYYNRHKFQFMSDTEFELFVARDKYQRSVTDAVAPLAHLFTKTFDPYTTQGSCKSIPKEVYAEAINIVKTVTDLYNKYLEEFNRLSELCLASFEETRETIQKVYTVELNRQRIIMQCRLINIINLLTTFNIIIEYKEEDLLDESEEG